ncbi:MAG: kynureninase [Micrococcales bacterium]|nr:kynureninase [Micrococcales bacterium]
MNTWTREACERLDEQDPLRDFRGEFALPEGVIYLDGNSLGARPKAALERAERVVADEWGLGLIRSWNSAGWFDLPGRLGDQLSTLLGGGDGTTVVTDTTSVNLFKALSAAARIQAKDTPGRRVIVSERDNFPTDLYIIEGVIGTLGGDYELRLIDAGRPLDEALDESVAIVTLSHVNYRTGRLWDLASVTAQVQDTGALMVWDLSHSAGAVPIALEASGADMAVGCTYKYLNGGPGSPAFIWVAKRHQERFSQPLSGWWGHARPFAMETAYEPSAGIERFLCGTQPITSMSMVETGLDAHLRVDQTLLRDKSLALTDLFIELVAQRCGDHPLTLITPRDHGERGSHVSFRHPEGYAVMQALIARGVIGDYREPEVLRFGVTPLYLGFSDIWNAVEALRDILDTRAWDTEDFHRREAVT